MTATERAEQHSQNMAKIEENNNQLRQIGDLLDALVAQRDGLKAENNLFRIHLVNFLNTWEAKWDRKDLDKSELSYEEIEEYKQAASFMAKFGRTNNRIDEVTEYIETITI